MNQPMVQYNAVQVLPSKEWLSYALTDGKEYVFCAIAQKHYPPSQFPALLSDMRTLFYQQNPEAEQHLLSRGQVQPRFVEELATKFDNPKTAVPAIVQADQKAHDLQIKIQGTMKAVMADSRQIMVRKPA